ncbi:MAG: hypothetical protein EBX52_09525 [Proteobacteria bacterium]|nr:hypothetical protein [Pseudomonadota bacterium]
MISLLAFSSHSIPAGLLLLFAIEILAFMRMCRGTRRDLHASSLKWFILVFLGCMIALFGAALGEVPAGRALLVSGLLLMVPNGITNFFFGGFFEQQTLRSLLGSVLIPAFVAIDILLKSKSGAKADLGAGFEVALQLLGGLTLIHSALLAYLRQRIKSVLVHAALAWVGAALLFGPFDPEGAAPVVFSSIAVFSVLMVPFLALSSQLGPRYFSFARIAALGLPGTIGFASVFFAMKESLVVSPFAIGALFAGQLLLIMALVSCRTRDVATPDRSLKIRFWMIAAVQWISGCGACWYGMGGMR